MIVFAYYRFFDSSHEKVTEVLYIKRNQILLGVVFFRLSSNFSLLDFRLVEQAVQRQGWAGLEDVLRHLPGETFERQEARSAKGGKIPPSASKVVLVYFIGGVTYSEVAALRFLAKQKGYNLLIATTAVTNGTRMISSFVETVR